MRKSVNRQAFLPPLLLLLSTVAVVVLFSSPFSVEAACVGDPSDACPIDAYAAACKERKRASLCCFPCSSSPSMDGPSTTTPTTTAPPPVEMAIIDCSFQPAVTCAATAIATNNNNTTKQSIDLFSLLSKNALETLPQGCSFEFTLDSQCSSDPRVAIDPLTGRFYRTGVSGQVAESNCQPTLSCGIHVQLAGPSSQCHAVCSQQAPQGGTVSLKRQIVSNNNNDNDNIRRVIDSPYPSILRDCRDVDNLRIDLATLRGEFLVPDEVNEVPPWLVPELAFRDVCGGDASGVSILTTSTEHRDCAQNLIFTLKHVVTIPDNSSNNNNGCGNGKPIIFEMQEVFTLPVQQPTMEELIAAPSIIAVDSVADDDIVARAQEEERQERKAGEEQCLANNFHRERTIPWISSTSNCNGGRIQLQYKEEANVRIVTASNDDSPSEQRSLKTTWTIQGCQAPVYTQEQLIRDTTPPALPATLASLPTTPEDSIILQCMSYLQQPERFALTFQDNCDGPIVVTPTVEVTESPQEGDPCRNRGKAKLHYLAKDKSGNENRLTLNVIIASTNPPVVKNDQGLQSSSSSSGTVATIQRHCRSHVQSTALTTTDLLVTHECLGDFYVPLSSEVIRDVRTARQIEQWPECLDQVDIEHTWILSDNCSDPVTHQKVTQIRNNEGPRWVSETGLPPETVVLQCRRDFHRNAPVLTSRNECEQRGVEQQITAMEAIHWALPNGQETAAGGCFNDGRVTYTWTATNKCGLTNTYVQEVTIRDTLAPEIVEDYEQHVHYCIWPANNRYMCFTGITERARALVRGDNCGGHINIRLESLESYDCNDISDRTCTTKTPSTTNQRPYAHYVDRDTICLRATRPSASRSRLYQAAFTISDTCQNSATLPMSFLVPGPPIVDDSYNREGNSHPCDRRILVEMPRQANRVANSEYGSIYMLDKLPSGNSDNSNNNNKPNPVKSDAAATLIPPLLILCLVALVIFI